MASTTPAGISRSSNYFPELECLRGIAIVLVVLFHADGLVRFPFGNTLGMWVSPLRALMLGGHTGVSLFFVLSGFLLALPFLAEVDGRRRVDRLTFYRRRALRILPLYWAVLAVGFLATVRSSADLAGRIGYFAFVNSVPQLCKPMVPFTNVVWTLATEVQFYAVLPLLPACLRSRRRALALMLAFGSSYGVFLTGAVGRSSEMLETFLEQGVFGRMPQFACGIVAAAIHRRYAGRLAATRLLRKGLGDLLLLACIVALGCLLQRVVYGGYGSFNHPPLYAWYTPEGVLWAAMLLLVLEVPLVARPLLVNPQLARLGVLSYSMYLIHMPVYWYSLGAARRIFGLPAEWTLGNVAWLATALLAVYLLSEITYRVIERPFLERKAQLS
jgi:peptidoglycan/LPS O-acetylase OafA/YrhL